MSTDPMPDTADTAALLRRAAEVAPSVLPEPIARLVSGELERGLGAVSAVPCAPYIAEYAYLARAVLALAGQPERPARAAHTAECRDDYCDKRARNRKAATDDA